MLRLPRSEQIIILHAADKHPGPLAEWLRAWINAQEAAPSGTGINIAVIPIPEPVPETTQKSIAAYNQERRDARPDREEFLKTIGYREMDIIQRRAVRKLGDSKIAEIEESDLLPADDTCWIGQHQPEEWEDTTIDNFLWKIIGTWNSGKELKKWGCEACARAIKLAHPEAKFHAFN